MLSNADENLGWIADNTWYVAVERFGDRFYSFVAAAGENYRGFKNVLEETGIKVVGERFGITDDIIDGISNHPDGKLCKLVARLNNGEDLDVQKCLDELENE